MKNLVRTAAAAAAVLLVVALAGPASAAADDRGARWLSHQLTGGLVHNDQYAFDDYGLTADVAFALKAIGGHGDDLKTIRHALAENVDNWTTGGSFAPDDIYAGSVAKAVVLAQVTGADPTSFGGVDLVQRLEDRTRNAAPKGRIQDKTADDSDYANTIGQAVAARGLARAGSDEATAAIGFLLKQQCDQGFFRLSFAPKGAAKQGCDAGTKAESSPDTDVTALALIELSALPKADRTSAVKHSIADGVSWLKHHQARNGSFGGGTSTSAPNSNSTGLAAWALNERGACGAARDAARWVKALQVKDEVAGERGAIAYDRAAFDAAKTDGIGAAQQDQWRRATSQAAPGLSALGCS